MLRVKCVKVPEHDDMVDINFIKGKFYDVEQVHYTMDGIQYLSMFGEMKMTVTAPAQYFSRPAHKKGVKRDNVNFKKRCP